MENPAQPTQAIQQTQTQQSYSIPPTVQPKPRNKLPLIIGTVVLILLISGAGALYIGTKDKTETSVNPSTTITSSTPTVVPSEQAYIDKTYNFSITYDNSHASEVRTSNTGGVYYLCIYHVGGSEKPCTSSVEVYDNQKQIPLEQWANLYATPIQTYGGTASPTKGTFNGYPAMIVVNETEKVRYLSNGPYIYKVSNVADAPPAEIADTFKFTN